MRYVIIGNSAAAIGAVEGIRQTDTTGEITVISSEPHHTYSRPLISYLLLGKVTEESMKYRPDSFYAGNNCTLIFACATKIDAKNKTVYIRPVPAPGSSVSGNSSLKAGRPDTVSPQSCFPQSVSYDKLLIAAGSAAFVPPIEGLDTVKEKYTFMSLDDARMLGKAVSKEKRVLIIGAGLIGLKCAEGIAGSVKQITVLDLAPRILPSILDEDGAKMVQDHIEKNGIGFILSGSLRRFDKNTAILSDGTEIGFDILVLAMGVRPNTGLLAGIADIDKGIIIDEKSQTTARDIYAAGDCTQTLDISSGESKIMALLPNAYMQGECAGINMAGGDKSFDKAIPMNAIGFFGLHLITAGTYKGEEHTETGEGFYKRFFYSDNKLNGYILIGSIDKAGIYTSLISGRIPLDSIDFELIRKKPGLMAFAKEDRAAMLSLAQ